MATCLTIVLGSAPAASAAGEPQAGWWSTAPAGANLDAPEGGLVVQGGPDPAAPLSYAALSYDLADGERPTSLRLTVAPGSASTPNTTLAACPLVDGFSPADGAAVSGGPKYDCTTKATAAASADGSTYELDVADLSTDGSFAVAIVPTAPTDRVVLERPGSQSLATTVGSGGSGSTSGSFDTAASSEPALEPSPGFDLGPSELARPAEPSLALDPLPAPSAASTAPAASPPASPAAGRPVTAQPAAASAPDTSSGSRLPAFLLVAALAVAAGLWHAAGREQPTGELA